MPDAGQLLVGQHGGPPDAGAEPVPLRQGDRRQQRLAARQPGGQHDDVGALVPALQPGVGVAQQRPGAEGERQRPEHLGDQRERSELPRVQPPDRVEHREQDQRQGRARLARLLDEQRAGDGERDRDQDVDDREQRLRGEDRPLHGEGEGGDDRRGQNGERPGMRRSAGDGGRRSRQRYHGAQRAS